MKKIALGLLAVLILLCVAGPWWLKNRNAYQLDGELSLSILDNQVTLHRDKVGIPYIFASSLADAIRTQGFVMGQDRVFQVELYRAIIRGELASVVGEVGIESDVKMRVLGILSNATRHARYLDAESREFLQWYADGYNEFVVNKVSEYPLELDLLNLTPSKLSVEELLAVQHYAGFVQSRNYEDEILSLQLATELGDRAMEIAPLNINPDRLFQQTRSSDGVSDEIVSLSQLATKQNKNYSPPVALPTLGSNNWITGSSRSSNNKPILTNDPHLDASILPGPWFPVGIFTPEISAVGANIPGVPGLMVGRNRDIAFGVTNAYGDSQDLFVERVDPANPNHYLEGVQSIAFELDEQKIQIKDSDAEGGYRSQTLLIRRTTRGPIISDHDVFGLAKETPISFRAAAAEIQGSSIGLRDLLVAKNIDQADAALSKIDVLYMNYLFADKNGGIAHRPTGAIPIRQNGEVAQIVSDQDSWQGFIPKEEMPITLRPNKDWLGTSNHDVVPDNYPYFYSTHFSPNYRYLRTKEWVSQSPKKSAQDHWQLVVDNKNLHAQRLVPVFLEALQGKSEFNEFTRLLGEWNFEDHVSSSAATVFHLMHEYLTREMLEGKLSPKLTERLLAKRYYWLQRFDQLIENKDSYWMDNAKTEQVETADLLIQSAAQLTKDRLIELKGNNPESWRWGEFHKVRFLSPLRQKGIGSGLLGGGAHEANGSGETLNRGQYSLNEGPYRSQWFSSMRMVADLSDDKKIMANISGGNSARQFHPYFKSQLDSWLQEQWLPWWLDKQSIEANSQHELRLKPN
ncbi:MAG: penicillin acylase family protein [Gammaproteobacteria bacterium]|nr:penicillin acylase family protein [Gammaproteobacteria bacterium]